MAERPKKSYLTLILTGGFAFMLWLNPNMEDFIKISYIATLYFFLKFITTVGKKIPLVEFTLFVASFQYLLSPALDYEFLGRYHYFKMQIPAARYYEYVLPAFAAFWIGLSLPLFRQKFNEAEMVKTIAKDKKNNGKIGLALVAVGVIFSGVQTVVQLPALAFFISLLSLTKFVGLLYIWLSDLKYARLIIIGVSALVVIETVRDAIFINLVVLAVFFFCFYALLNKVNVFKTFMVTLLAAGVLFLLQSVKKDYRKAVWSQGQKEGQFSLLYDLMSEKAFSFSGNTFLITAATVNQRLNQGWVLSGIMKHIPYRQPFLKGEVFYDELSGIFLPRFLQSGKATAQSADKFEKFAGYRLRRYTIAVGILGDGYGNFGPQGGAIFCFFVALFFNISIRLFYRVCVKYPSLFLWSLLIFFYLARAGDDFYIITNWIVKSSIFVALAVIVFKKYFRKRMNFPVRFIPGKLALN